MGKYGERAGSTRVRHRPTRRRFARTRTRLRRFRERVRANPLLDTAWRVSIFIFGWLVVFAGIIMLVFPGPGWGSIFLGFAILATEFVWARRALHKAKNVAQGATGRVLDPKVRRRTQAVIAVTAAVLIIGIGLYVWSYGVPDMVPFVGGPGTAVR